MKYLREKNLWQGKFIKTGLITYVDTEGVERSWESVGRLNCDGIIIVVPMNSNQEVLLIRQYRATHDNYVIELPAGLIDKGEDALAAGRRELIEETGYTSDKMKLMKGYVMSTGIDTDTWNIALALDIQKATAKERSQFPPDEGEHIEAFLVNIRTIYESLDKLSSEGNDIDLRIYGLVELAKRYL